MVSKGDPYKGPLFDVVPDHAQEPLTVKPTKIAVGQRWRYRGGPERVVSRAYSSASQVGRWVIRFTKDCDKGRYQATYDDYMLKDASWSFVGD